MWERRFVLAPLAELAPDLVDAAALAAAGGESRSWVHSDQLLLKATGTHWGWNAEGDRCKGPYGSSARRAGRSLAIALERAGWQTSLMGRAERHMAAVSTPW